MLPSASWLVLGIAVAGCGGAHDGAARETNHEVPDSGARGSPSDAQEQDSVADAGSDAPETGFDDVAPRCDDGAQNGNETGIDCGGSCGACAGAGCEVAPSLDPKCASGICGERVCEFTQAGGSVCYYELFCTTPTCSDTVKNGTEADVDCGGSCGGCAGAPCARDADCGSGICRFDACQAPTCSDLVRNGLETGVDCGGPCGRCQNDTCVSAADCASGACVNPCQGDVCIKICAAAPCRNGLKDETETDVDCGGSCLACSGSGCLDDSYCVSGDCSIGICREPPCADGTKNGTEVDVDCGGLCGLCGGSACANGNQCASGICEMRCSQIPGYPIVCTYECTAPT